MKWMLALITFCTSVNAATYYIDFPSGSDSNSGKLPTASWKHVPGDPNATGVPLSTKLAPGDSVLLKAGTAYVGAWVLSSSGASGAPITFNGQGWGTGNRCIITSSNKWSTVPGTISISDGANTVNWINFTNLHFYQLGGYAMDDPIWSGPPGSLNGTNDHGGAGIVLDGEGYHINIHNCKFEEIGTWTNSTVLSTSGLTGVGVLLQNNSFVTVSGCEFTRIFSPMYISSRSPRKIVDNITVISNDFHNYFRWGIDVNVGSVGSTVSNVYLVANMIHDYSEYDAGNWLGTGEKPHTDGIFFRAAVSGSTWTNSDPRISGVKVDRNKFWCDFRGNSLGGSYSVFVSEGASITCINNIFLNDTKVASLDLGYDKTSPYQRVWIFNNTFVNNLRANMVEAFNANEVLWHNNIHYRKTTVRNNAGTTLYRNTPTNFLANFNLYWTHYVPETEWRAVYDGAYRTFALWQLTGNDLNGKLANPMMVNPIGVDSTLDVSLKKGSPAINSATNLSYFFTHDFHGKTRNNWDIGAIAYTGDVPVVPPPENIAIRIKK